MKTTGNTILITGGTSGIGLGLALRWQAAGNDVVVAGRRTDLLDQIAADHPGIGTVQLDVTDPDSIARATETVLTGHPDLNVLVNNAGIMRPEDVQDPDSLATAEDHVTTNLLGPIRMVHALLPHLLTREGAAVLNVTSALAYVPWPLTPTYAATKAALASWTDSLRVQLAGSGVQVVEVVPPGVRTTLMGQQDSEHAMPLDDFLTETMSLLARHPDAAQVVPERARFARDAEREGRYEQVLAMLSAVSA